jgi:hypothetical protein
MKNLITFLFLLLTTFVNSQISLQFANPIDTGTGLNRVIVYPFVGVYNGLDLDMVVSVDGYYSSVSSDTNWYNNVTFRAISGDFNIEIPYTNNFTRCVDLTYRLVEHSTNNCVNADLETLIYDLDSSRFRNEYFSTSNYDSFLLFNPTFITPIVDSNETYFFSSGNVNESNMAGAVGINFNQICEFRLTFCVNANNSRGNAGYFLSAIADTFYFLAIDDVIIDDFKGYSEGCINYLMWKTSKEENLDYYVLQYSVDGVYFVDLGDIVNIINDYPKIYTYTSMVYGNTNYYRLKLIYNDKSFVYSKVIYINSDCIGKKTKVFPNPFESTINIASEDDIISVEIFNSIGEKLMDVNINDSRNISIDFTGYDVRTIMLKITYEGGISKILKLVKYL